MKFLFVLTYYTPHWTGLTEHAKRLAEGQITKGHISTIIATQHDSSLPFEEIINKVQVLRTPVWFRLSRTLVSPLFFFKVWQELKKADRIVVYTPLAEVVLVSIIARISGKKLIIIHNGDLLLPAGIGNRIIEKLFDISSYISGMFSEKIIAYSQDYAENSRFLKHFLNKTTAILPLFPSVKKFSTPQSLLSYNVKSRYPIIGCAGRFVEEKGFDVLLKAIPQVVKIYPKALFVFAGETKMVYENFYEKNSHLLDEVKENFLSLGRLTQSEMSGFYKGLDVFVLPSRSDCLAFVQVEAMLSGVPVVATDIPGARIPVIKTGMGELVEVNDPNDLALGIVKVLKNIKSYEKNMGLVREFFDYQKTLTDYERIIIT